MRWGIRAQVLFALAGILGLGLLGSFAVTSRVTRSALVNSRTQEIRQLTALAAERFSDLPPRGHINAETLAQLQPLLGDVSLVLLGSDLRPLVAHPDVRARFEALIPRREMAPVPHDGVASVLVRGTDRQTYVLALAKLTRPPALAGAGPDPGVPAHVCLLASLAPTLHELDTLERLSLLVIGTILTLAVLLGYIVLGRLVLGPVTGLARLMGSVARSGLDGPGAADGLPSGAGELGQLQDAFHKLTRQLAADQRRNQRQLGELERANRELEAAQAQLVVTEKLATVGQLAAGVAHEIGNPIAILQGYLEIIRDPDLPEATRHEYVAIMEGAVERVGTIIRDLLDFARQERQDENVCDAAEVVRSASKLVRPQKRFRGLTLDVQVPDVPVSVAANPGRLEQVLLNLLFNAADASPDGGTVFVTITTDAGKMILTVEDQGDGLERGDMVKVFDPFYTTKEPGSGTGLGLAISHSIAHSYGGTIHVRSEKGEGAAFSIILPLADPSAAG